MPEKLSLADKREIDAVCDRFESAWNSSSPPAIESFLCFDGQKRERLFVELVRLDLQFRRAKDENASLEDYRQRFPQLVGEIGELEQTRFVERDHVPQKRLAGWSLVVLDDSPEVARHSLKGAGSLKIGRHPKLAIFLPNDSKVSAEHAQVDWSTTWCRVADLGSKNGTYVNEIRIAEAWLLVGDVLRIGRTSFRVERAE